jgi:hypothetical protein
MVSHKPIIQIQLPGMDWTMQTYLPWSMDK